MNLITRLTEGSEGNKIRGKEVAPIGWVAPGAYWNSITACRRVADGLAWGDEHRCLA